MSGNERWFPGHLKELSEADCLELLGEHHVGRVAYCDQDGPVVIPVNYVVEDRGVLLRLSPHASLAPHLRSADASFQIDEFDDYTQSGWSVLLRGHATYVDIADHPDAVELIPWAEGQRSLLVRIAAREITGRRLMPA